MFCIIFVVYLIFYFVELFIVFNVFCSEGFDEFNSLVIVDRLVVEIFVKVILVLFEKNNLYFLDIMVIGLYG